MFRHSNSLVPLYAIALVVFGTILGCNKSPVTSVTENEASNGSTESKVTTAPPVVDAQASSVVVSKNNTIASPAASEGELPPATTQPDLVCKRFMQLLQSGNRISAENLLTKTALTTTSRAELSLEPMGGPTSKYEFGDTRYATNRKKLAQVDCSVVETVEGETFRMDLTWVVRKQKSGWRISGVMLELEPGKVKDFLSFENYQDVERMKMLAGGEVIENSDPAVQSDETRQANAAPKTIK